MLSLLNYNLYSPREPPAHRAQARFPSTPHLRFMRYGRAIRTIKMAGPLGFAWHTRKIEEETRTVHYETLSAPCRKHLYYNLSSALDLKRVADE